MKYIRHILATSLFFATEHAYLCAAPQQAVPSLPPGTIDGSKTPGQIPDLTAYRLVFRAFAEAPDATPAQLARQRRKLAHFATLDSDFSAFSSVLTTFYAGYTALITQYQSNPAAQSQPFTTARDALVTGAIAQLNAKLSPNALMQFATFVQNAKQRMTIVPAGTAAR